MVLVRLISDRPKRVYFIHAYQMNLAPEIYAAEMTEERKGLIELTALLGEC